MGRFHQDLFTFYQRQADRLIMLAEDCTNRATKAHLIEMAGEYLDKLDAIAIEHLTRGRESPRSAH
jgi:hypothetical protein